MSITTTISETLAGVLDVADPNEVAAALRLTRLGTMLTPLKETITLAAPGTVFTLSKPALKVVTCQVTVGTVTGDRIMTDSAGTVRAPHDAAAPGVAKLADNGTTITFDASVTTIIVTYIPRSYTDVTGAFKRS